MTESKKIPTIVYEKQTRRGTCDIETEHISVSDTTSELAFKTMEKVRKLCG